MKRKRLKFYSKVPLGSARVTLTESIEHSCAKLEAFEPVEKPNGIKMRYLASRQARRSK